MFRRFYILRYPIENTANVTFTVCVIFMIFPCYIGFFPERSNMLIQLESTNGRVKTSQVLRFQVMEILNLLIFMNDFL